MPGLKTRFFPLLLVSVWVLVASVWAGERVTCDHGLRPRKELLGTNLAKPRFGAPMPTSPRKRLENLVPVDHYEVEFKILILSAVDDEETDPGLKLAIETLESFWIPYEVIVLTKEGVKRDDLKLVYTNSDGSAKYSGVITTEFNLSYKDKKTQTYKSALSERQWDELFRFVRQFRLRHVSLFTYPQAYVGVEEIPGRDHGGTNQVSLVKESMAGYTSGMRTDWKIGIKDVWHYPVKILPQDAQRTRPIAFFADSSVAAISHQTEDQREQLHFFFTQGKDLLLSKVMAPIWLKWLVHNLYVGKRRTYLSAQVDDVFIPTVLWSRHGDTEHQLYRSRVDDLKGYLQFQREFLRKETHDRHFKIEMAFNGKGILDYGGLNVDPLTLFLQREAAEFSWVSHTYHHYELDHLSYGEVVNEVVQNNQAALAFLKENIGLYSTKGLVTPRISGLFNPEALEAFADQNYFYVVGDNLVKNLAPLNNRHLPRKTTRELNGFAGITILPRFPNDIFYNVSNPQELQGLFNHLYGYRGNDRLGIEEILEKNAHELTHALLSLDYSMHMFHQANMRLFKYQGREESLLSLWFKRGVSEFRKYSTLPLKSLSLDEVVAAYKERVQYEQCAPKVRLKYTHHQLKEIQLKATHSCLVPVTGLESFALLTPELKKIETFGPDQTLYIQVGPDDEVSVFVD